MLSVGDRSSRVALAMVPTIVVGLGCGASLIPHELVTRGAGILAAWLSLALPVGIAFGHCALEEADRA